jgi:hypothetical protein
MKGRFIMRPCFARRLALHAAVARRLPAVLFLAAIIAVIIATNRRTQSAEEPSRVSTRPAAGLVDVSSTPELLEAITRIRPEGGTIRLRPGDYVIEGTIEIREKNSVNITGTGWDTRLIRRGDGDAIRLIDAGFCTIRNVVVLGDEAAKSGSAVVYQGSSSSCTIDFCRICNFAESGVRYEGDPKAPMSSNTIRDCHLIGNLGDQLWSHQNNDFYIVGNQFGTHRGFPRSGCVLDHSSAGTYTMNYHWGNHVALRLGPGSNFNRVQNNRFEESRETGLILGDPQGGDWNTFHIILGNTFHTNSQEKSGEYPAVAAYDAHEITFCANQVFSWNASALKHKHSLVLGRNCDKWIVKDNIFRHSSGKAFTYDKQMQIVARDNLTD